MAKVQFPLLSMDAWKDFGRMITFKRGGVVTRYFRPRDPKSAKQLTQRQLFRLFWRFTNGGTMLPIIKALLVGPNEEPMVYNSNTSRGVFVFDLAWSEVINAGVTLFGMLNTQADKSIYVRRFWIQFGFTGTAAASMMNFRLGVLSGVQYITGAGLLVGATKRNGLSVETAHARANAAGITVQGGLGGMALERYTWRRNGDGSPKFETSYFDQPIELAPGEMLGLYLDANSVIGDRSVGGVDWSA